MKNITPKTTQHILLFSATSKLLLADYINWFIDYLRSTTDEIKDIATALYNQKNQFTYRLAISCFSTEDAINKLSNINDNNIYEVYNYSPSHPSEIIFMFSGQGNQYVNMTLNLYSNEIVYKNLLDNCIQIANKHLSQLSISFEQIIFPELYGNIDKDINQTQFAQIALFITSYSLAKFLATLNIHASCYIGHSIGEYVAATLAEVFSLEDAIFLVITRGKLMQSMPSGSMLSIKTYSAQIGDFLLENNCRLSVINSPISCVASGGIDDIKNLKLVLKQAGIASIILNVSHAYHSPAMLDAANQFLDEIKKVRLSEPQKPFISNLSGQFITKDQAISHQYWADHIMQPVLFAQGVETLLQYYSRPLFIELGAGKSCITFVKEQHATVNAVNLISSQKEAIATNQKGIYKEDILAKLWSAGYMLNLTVDNPKKAVKLPEYK